MVEVIQLKSTDTVADPARPLMTAFFTRLDILMLAVILYSRIANREY